MSPKFTALYDYEIDAYLQSVKGYRGCHSKDWFKGKNPKATEYVVINLDDSGGPGTHWTCLANRRDEDFIVYFDSFGIDPPQEISIVYAFVQKTLKNDKILEEKLEELGISVNS